jgi:type IV pilus modification protein PilV
MAPVAGDVRLAVISTGCPVPDHGPPFACRAPVVRRRFLSFFATSSRIEAPMCQPHGATDTHHHRRTRGQGQGGFTLLEILIALTVTVIGLLGVMMMQASTVRSNREAALFTRAANFAEEVMERTRGIPVATLQGGMSFTPITVNNTTFFVSATATDVSLGSNLAVVRVEVRYNEENDTATSGDDRRAVVEMLRTKAEAL